MSRSICSFVIDADNPYIYFSKPNSVLAGSMSSEEKQ